MMCATNGAVYVSVWSHQPSPMCCAWSPCRVVMPSACLAGLLMGHGERLHTHTSQYIANFWNNIAPASPPNKSFYQLGRPLRTHGRRSCSTKLQP